METKDSKRYLFVCGCPRSGTTALMHLLNSHRLIVLGVERYKKFAKPTHIKKLNKRVFEPEFFLDIRGKQTNLHHKHKDWDTKWKKVYDAMRPKLSQDNLLIGDKFPHYYLFYDYIDQTFDSPRIVFILRDVRDVALSYNARAANEKDRWSSYRDYTYAVKDWNESIEKTLQYLDSGKDNIFICEYAALFSYNPDYLLAMLNFLQVDVYSDITDYYHNMTSGWEERMRSRKYLPPEQEEYVSTYAQWDMRDDLLARYGTRSAVQA